jgi:hypothetical protein
LRRPGTAAIGEKGDDGTGTDGCEDESANQRRDEGRHRGGPRSINIA